MQDLNLKTQCFQVAGEVLFRQVENEAVLLKLPDGAYYSLNEISIPFWEALRDQLPLEAVVKQIAAEYAVEPEQVTQDLQVFLKDLLDYGLIAPVAD